MTFDPAAKQAKASRGGQRRETKSIEAAATETTLAEATETKQEGGDEPSSSEPPAPPAGDPAAPPANDPPSTEPPVSTTELAHVMVRIPTHTYFGDGKYATQRIDTTLTRRRAAAAAFGWASMSEEGARYEGGQSYHPEGTNVNSPLGMLNKILDDLADGIEAQHPGLDLTKDFGFIFRQ